MLSTMLVTISVSRRPAGPSGRRNMWNAVQPDMCVQCRVCLHLVVRILIVVGRVHLLKGNLLRKLLAHAHCLSLQICICIHVYIYIYDAGLPHPPSPPSPWYPPVPVKWVVVLFVLVAFPVWSCLASSPPPPVEWGLWSFCLAPPRLWGAVCSTEVWYGCCHLLLVMSSLRALSPPPLWGGACGRFGWPRPACVGQCVLQRYGMVAAAC